jgi:hypothetical protein
MALKMISLQMWSMPLRWRVGGSETSQRRPQSLDKCSVLTMMPGYSIITRYLESVFAAPHICGGGDSDRAPYWDLQPAS